MMMPSQWGKLYPVTTQAGKLFVYGSLGHIHNEAMKMPSRPLTLRPAVADDLSQGTVISESLAAGKIAHPSDGNSEPVIFPAFLSSRNSQFKRLYVIILAGFIDCDHVFLIISILKQMDSACPFGLPQLFSTPTLFYLYVW